MFTENQSRQLYVVTATGSDVIAPTQIITGTSGTYPTDLSAKSAGACQFVINPSGEQAYFNYKGASSDGLQRSALLNKFNIKSIVATDADDMKHKLKKLEIALDSNVSSDAVVGQDYILNVNIKNYIACGDDSTKVKFGVAHATSTTASDLYKKLAISLAKNFDREPVKLLSIYVKKNDNSLVAVTPKSTVSGLSGTMIAVVLEEAEQPWRRGAAPVEYVNFEATPSTIYVNTLDQIWGTVTDVTANNSNALVNSKKVADMEWFFHKERGDKYAEVGFPNNIDTTYQVDPSNASGYSMVDIHFYEDGNSMNVGRSEKTITLVGTKTNLKKLIGSARVTGGSPADPTGLYAFTENTNVSIQVSASWA